MNLAQLLSDQAKLRPKKPAVVFEGTTHTFRHLDRQIEVYAAMLQELDVKPGDRVAIQLSKCMEFIYLHLATLAVGAITLPLNSDYRAEEIEYFLSDSESRVFFTDARRFHPAREILAGLPVRTVIVGSNAPSTELSLEARLAEPTVWDGPTYAAGGDDVAMICYTSGTTGRSKGAMITHRNLIANMGDLQHVWEWTDRDVLLHALPLFHVHGLVVALHGGLNAGSTIVMHERFDPRRVWETIEREGCTMLMGVPTMYQRLMNEWDTRAEQPSLQSMRVFISGSAPLLEGQFLRFERATGFRILERYGMTETGMNTSNPFEPTGRKSQSVGYPLPSTQIRVVGEDGVDAPSGQVGEVLIRGANVFKGYWAMPEKTRESFVEGWFRSGDLGYLDREDGGRLYLVGRAKELIITGGYNVYPKEIENVLETHPAVHEAAVVGLADEDFGERVTAVVVPEEAGKASEQDLIGFCKTHLAGFKCPKQVVFVTELPRNAMGKLQKNQLVEQYGQV
jgi:malonyl-CoA/methylmalonyl-CoA synthetase